MIWPNPLKANERPAAERGFDPFRVRSHTFVLLLDVDPQKYLAPIP